MWRSVDLDGEQQREIVSRDVNGFDPDMDKNVKLLKYERLDNFFTRADNYILYDVPQDNDTSESDNYRHFGILRRLGSSRRSSMYRPLSQDITFLKYRDWGSSASKINTTTGTETLSSSGKRKSNSKSLNNITDLDVDKKKPAICILGKGNDQKDRFDLDKEDVSRSQVSLQSVASDSTCEGIITITDSDGCHSAVNNENESQGGADVCCSIQHANSNVHNSLTKENENLLIKSGKFNDNNYSSKTDFTVSIDKDDYVNKSSADLSSSHCNQISNDITNTDTNHDANIDCIVNCSRNLDDNNHLNSSSSNKDNKNDTGNFQAASDTSGNKSRPHTLSESAGYPEGLDDGVKLSMLEFLQESQQEGYIEKVRNNSGDGKSNKLSDPKNELEVTSCAPDKVIGTFKICFLNFGKRYSLLCKSMVISVSI